MTGDFFFLQLFGYSFAWWLGLYLIGRNPASGQLRLTGLGLLAYALALGLDLLIFYLPAESIWPSVRQLQKLLLFLPSLYWAGTTVYLLPAEIPLRRRLLNGWSYGLLPVAIIFFLLSADSVPVNSYIADSSRMASAYLLFSAVILLPLIGGVSLLGYTFRSRRPHQPLGTLMVMTLFLILSAGLLLYPIWPWLSRFWLVLSMGLDLVLLGLGIAILDAFDEGESLLPDMLLSLDTALFSTLVFAGPVALVLILASKPSGPMVGLLLVMIALAVARQVFATQLDTVLDRISLAMLPALRHTRAELRTTASVLPRINNSLDPDTLDEDQFVRLTRRALSHFGDVSRLATSPLTRLPIITAKLQAQGENEGTLGRAIELKAILTNSIERLKPPGQDQFGTSNEWRYFNALYFPYVKGLKPYSRRADHTGLDPVSQEALDWFRSSVPERTLYNWQTVAARLVAQDLRERTPES